MALGINHNIEAAGVARNLNAHHAALFDSVRRLSSGLRVGRSADDAAGLAIREMMRSDITALHQGVRNANDAISLIQTADGAFSIIDEKLIRMKELAEQAATGTYNSDQRLMIDSEFQAMAAEIDRIANATDFNGVHLLNGNLAGAHDGTGLASQGKMKIHFGSGNDSAEDYYYLEMEKVTTRSLLFGPATSGLTAGDLGITWPGAEIIGNQVVFNITNATAGSGAAAAGFGLTGLDHYVLPVGLKNVNIYAIGTDGAPHKSHVSIFTRDGTQLTGVDPAASNFQSNTSTGSNWWNGRNRDTVIAYGKNGNYFDSSATYTNSIVNNAGDTVTSGGMTVSIIQTQDDNWGGNASQEQLHVDTITNDLVFFIGGHLNPYQGCNVYSLQITAELDTSVFGDPPGVGYDFSNRSISIRTQAEAQKMLASIDNGMVNTGRIRAHLGATQNRLENTISNLQIQAENLQTAESRISDVDVALEMTNFAQRQILTQASVAMLSQANSLPQMALGLING